MNAGLWQEFMMRSFALAVGIVGLLLSLAAFSEEVRLGDSAIKVASPKGFCELDKKNNAEVALLNNMTNYVKVGGFSLIALYVDCHELEESRKSNAFILTKIVIARFAKHTERPPSQFISEACDKLREGFSDEQKARISKYVTDFSKGNSDVQNTLSLGVLDEVRGSVCYSGQLIKAKIADIGEITAVYLTAGTFVSDQPIGIFQWTNYADATSIAAALANLKIIYSNFAAANGKSP
jgi:hypothetical protein